MIDTYLTIKNVCEGQITEKRSKFLAFAYPIGSAEEVKPIVDDFRKRYYDARHVCWAYVLGAEGEIFRANDDGEPSGTAGKPIWGQIRSHNLTNILVLVVRYFGGVKLGTSGLIVAYKAAAAECLQVAEVIECTVDEQVTFSFEYPMMNSVMKVVKDLEPQIVSQTYDNDCVMTLQIRRSLYSQLVSRLQKVETLVLAE